MTIESDFLSKAVAQIEESDAKQREQFAIMQRGISQINESFESILHNPDFFKLVSRITPVSSLCFGYLMDVHCDVFSVPFGIGKSPYKSLTLVPTADYRVVSWEYRKPDRLKLNVSDPSSGWDVKSFATRETDHLVSPWVGSIPLGFVAKPGEETSSLADASKFKPIYVGELGCNSTKEILEDMINRAVATVFGMKYETPNKDILTKDYR